jgi:hypothetical protein
MKLKLCLLFLLFFCLIGSAFATVSIPANTFLFTLPSYNTAIDFSSAQTFTNVTRIGNFWYFDNLEFSVQNGNLTVDQLWTGNIFQGHISGSDGQLATVSIFDVAYAVPTSVTASSASVTEVLDSGSFLSSSSSCWFFDTGSGRTYMKILISGYTSFSANYNSAGGGTGGGGGGGGGAMNVKVSDCTVNVASGSSATALVPVSWNFMGTVTLTSITFQGDSASWLQGPSLPYSLGSGVNASVPISVNVSSGVAGGAYSIQVSCQFMFSGGAQSVVAHVTVNVGAAQASFFPSWLTSWIPSDLGNVFAQITSGFWSLIGLAEQNLWLVTMSVGLIIMLLMIGLVARRRRR